MIRSLYTAGTGMIAQQQNLDVISNNLANVNTTAFKAQRAEFQDLMYQTMRGANKADNGGGNPTGIQFGLGTKIVSTIGTFTQGNMIETGDPVNMAITGPGFFKIIQPDGTPAYTRDGTFKTDSDGNVVTSQGFKLDPPVTIPPNSTAITIQDTGEVFAIAPGASSATNVGKIEIVNFTNPAGLSRVGGNLYQETEASGAAISGAPGQNGTGKLQAGYVEGSNVEVVSEMTRMITAQRAYEINSKAIQTADDMLQIVNGLKR